MSDPVKTVSDNPNQPAVETPPAAGVTPVTSAPAAAPTPTPPVTETPTPVPITEPPKAAATPPAEPPKAPDPALTPPAVTPPPEIKYEVKAPEGMQVDPEFIPLVSPILKKHNVSNEVFQDVMGVVLKNQQDLPKRMLERDLAVTMKDPDIGGMNYGRTQGHVTAALNAFTHPEFRTLLARAGLANNLEFVRVFERIGKAMQGDTPARGSPDGAPQLSRAERMYGKTTPHA